MPNKFFLICGHGQLLLDEHENPPMFRSENVNVITFAPPAATCSYSPEGLLDLRTRSYNYLKTKTTDTSLATFWRRSKHFQEKMLGSKYCADNWIGYFAKKMELNYTILKKVAVFNPIFFKQK